LLLERRAGDLARPGGTRRCHADRGNGIVGTVYGADHAASVVRSCERDRSVQFRQEQWATHDDDSFRTPQRARQESSAAIPRHLGRRMRSDTRGPFGRPISETLAAGDSRGTPSPIT